MRSPVDPSEAPVSRLHDDDLWAAVRSEYVKETTTRDPALATEVATIREAMSFFDSDLGRRYIIQEFLGVGGAGIVFLVWDSTLRTSRALKIARPIEGKEDMVAGLLTEEISRLQEVSHPHVISIFDAGLLKTPSGDLPFYTMTYLRGALNGYKFFSSRRSADQFMEFLQGLLTGIQHLHSASLLHLDIKPSNVFVAEDGFAVVADLGGARKRTGNPESALTITCTTSYAHPELLRLTTVSTAGDDNRRRGTVLRKDLRAEFDRFALGKTLLVILNAFEVESPGELSRYQDKYLRLLAARLLDGKTLPNERALGLSETSLLSLKYDSMDRACTDLDKLLGRVNLLHLVPETSPINDSVIQTTRGRTTPLTPRLKRLLREPLLRRLGSISQLGLVRLVYPGAIHTRLEHSLGAFSNAAEYLTALYNDPINPLFRQIMSQHDIVATLLAALLHDLGQYQHAHDLDDVEPAIFRHDTLTISLLKGEWFAYRSLTDSLRTHLQKWWGVTGDQIVAILDANPNQLKSGIRERILHTIISGPLDVDKLDYLLRDSTHCQTAYGDGLDRTRLLATLTIIYQREGAGDSQYFALGIHEKGRAAAESLGFIRFQMFRAVYWHHAVRSAKAMLQRAALEWIASDGRTSKSNDELKHELHAFLLGAELPKRAGITSQPILFDTPPSASSEPIGYGVRPQWTGLNHADVEALEWLHRRTTDVGRYLIQALIQRQLYKRVFVVSAVQDRQLWDAVQGNATNHRMLRERSEDLRKAIKRRIDEQLDSQSSGTPKFMISGVGEDSDGIINAARVLGGEGTVLIDLPTRRSGEELRFYPEELHRGQREEFKAAPLLAVSELWRLLSKDLHETAGSIRIFVHPDIDVLRSARSSPDSEPLLSPAILDEELRSIVGLPSVSSR